jgi:hypothetical protein
MRLDSLRLALVLAGVGLLVGFGLAANKPVANSTPAPKPQPKPAAPKPPAPAPAPARPAQARPNPAPRRNTNTTTTQNRTRTVTINTDYTITFNDEKGKVRLMDEPFEFDERGKRKKFTAAELKKLKGDTPREQKLAGYKAEYSDMKVGDSIKVNLYTFKPNKKKKADKDEEKADTKKDADKKDADKEEAKKDDAKKDDKKDDKETAKADKDLPTDDLVTEDGRWVVAGALEGTVTKADKVTGGSLKFTMRVTTTQDETYQVRVNQNGQVVNNNPNNNNNNNQNNNQTTRNDKQDIDPAQKQALLIIIAKRPQTDSKTASSN